MTRLIALLTALAALPLAACQAETSEPAETAQPAGAPEQIGDPVIPDPASTEVYDGIEPDETLRFTGTEPFWGGEVSGKSLTYSTPEDQDGTVIAVERFAGRGGISYSGLLEGADFEMVITPLECSDGMSDRTYPFTATLSIGEDKRNGCAWSEQHPFDGSEHP